VFWLICPECGTELVKGARYCHQCGWDRKRAAAGTASSYASHRPAWKRRLMAGTLLFFSLLMGWLVLMPNSNAAAKLQVGQAAPTFSLPDRDGKTVSLADLKGRPVVLNFWASWCPPCRREMPEFAAALAKYKEKDLAFYAINVGESKVVVDAFLSQVGVDLPVLLDQGDEAQNAYKILPLPATFFIDRSGKITAIYETQMSLPQIETEVERILAR
jgi:peroxiredoxin